MQRPWGQVVGAPSIRIHLRTITRLSLVVPRTSKEYPDCRWVGPMKLGASSAEGWMSAPPRLLLTDPSALPRPRPR
eukprot:4645093-Prymnesium_polylepis.1